MSLLWSRKNKIKKLDLIVEYLLLELGKFIGTQIMLGQQHSKKRKYEAFNGNRV